MGRPVVETCARKTFSIFVNSRVVRPVVEISGGNFCTMKQILTIFFDIIVGFMMG